MSLLPRHSWQDWKVTMKIRRSTLGDVEPHLSEQLLTTAELAAWLKVSERTLRRWRKTGRITAVEIGRTVRFRLSELVPCETQG